MPEWLHWIIEGLGGLFAIYIAKRLETAEEEKRDWEQRVERAEARLSSLENVFAADRAWRDANEMRRNEQHGENQRRMGVIDKKQDQALEKLDELSNRLASTRRPAGRE